ncbi:hypothetical protein WSS15_00210 [Acetobacter pasteurianus]|nr:hypothetical protein WSS15_00210 [Acetobacter pasteurianus]
MELKFKVSLMERLLPTNNNPLKNASLRIHVRKGIFSHPDVLFCISTIGVKSGESSNDERDSKREEGATGMSPARVQF